MKSLFVFLLLSFFTTVVFSGSLRIEKNENGKIVSKEFSTTRVPLEPSVSLAQVADFLNYKSNYNPATKIFQVFFQNHQLKIQENNPFVLVQSLIKAENMEIIQLPIAATVGSGDYYIPVSTLSKILKIVVDGEISVDDQFSVLAINKRIFDLNRVIVEEKSNGTLIRFPLLKKLEDFENHQDDAGNNYLTLVNVKGDIDALNAVETKGLMKALIATQLSSGALQIIVKVPPKETAGVDFQYNEKTQELYMSIRQSGENKLIQGQSTNVPIDQSAHLKDKWALDVIVLDAGHGGIDPGTHGAKGTKEKDVAFAVVKKLGAMIEKNYPEIKVVYTRNEDKKIPLEERGKIANKAKGKLFISVHCNANPKRSANGVETYFLGLHKSDEALEVSKRENSVILDEEDHAAKYKDFTDENLILLTMAQSAFIEQSEKIALNVSGQLSKNAGLQNRGVKQAGFIVLWTPSMPSILCEIGYLTNKNEEKVLSSKDGQEKIAKSIFNSIKSFKEDYEESLGMN